MQNNSPKPIRIAVKAIILHTFGVQVGNSKHRVEGLWMFEAWVKEFRSSLVGVHHTGRNT